MKIFRFVCMAAAALFLQACVEDIKENDVTVDASGVEFEISMTMEGQVATKTVSDEDANVTFAIGDKINLFHSRSSDDENYGSYVNDGCFTVTALNGKVAVLKGYIAEDLNPDFRYDWFAAYPYSSETTSPESVVVDFHTVVVNTATDASQTFAGEAFPLAGEAKAVKAADVPVLRMRQQAALVQVDVFNITDEDVVVNTVEIASNHESLAGRYVYDIHKYAIFRDDFQDYAYDEVYEEYYRRDAGPRYDIKSIVEPSHKVTLSTGGVVVESGETCSFFVPVAPVSFANLGSDLSIRVNNNYKPITMKGLRHWYIPCTGVSDFRYIRHKFLAGQATRVVFNYAFSDIEEYPSIWGGNDISGNREKLTSWFYNSTSLDNFMACGVTAKAKPYEDAYSVMSYIWLQSNGMGNPRRTGKDLPQAYSLWENEAFVFVIPAAHVAAGKSIAVETGMSVDDGHYGDDEHGADWGQKWYYGGAPYFMCEYSLDCGKTWKAANLTGWSTDRPLPSGANFVIDKVKTSTYLKAVCPVTSELRSSTFLYRMRAVHTGFNLNDVVAGATAGTRDIRYNIDIYNEPNTYGGINTLNYLDPDEGNVYARVSVE